MDEHESKTNGSFKIAYRKNIPVASFLKNFMQVLFVEPTLIDNRYAVGVK